MKHQRTMISIYEALADSSRRNILAQLVGGPKRVGEIVSAIGLKQPNVSNHLAKLRSQGLVDARKVGREVHYAISRPDVRLAVLQTAASKTETAPPLNLTDLASELVAMGIAGDELGCINLTDRVIQTGAKPIELYESLIAPAMREVGIRYLAGEIDEAREHLVSAIVERLLGRIASAAPTKAQNGRLAVLACPEGSRHVIGLRMASDYLQSEGWSTRYLGADVPTTSLSATVSSLRPDVLLLSCATDDACASTVEAIHAIQKEDAKPQIVLGGPFAQKCLARSGNLAGIFAVTSIEGLASHLAGLGLA